MSLGNFFRQVSQALFFPQACVLCDEWVLSPDLRPLCPTCFLSLERHDQGVCYYCGVPLPGRVSALQGICSMCRAGATPFDFARSYGPYAGKLRKSIWKFKFEGHRHLAHPLAALLEESLSASELETRPAWIVPVPAHPGRIRKRGFDQASHLGHALSRRLGVSVFSGLRRIKATRPQPGLNVQERLENIRDAFRLFDGVQLAARDVLIVDDVWTTGTTVAEVCRLLRHETPVDKILVVTLARVSRRYP